MPGLESRQPLMSLVCRGNWVSGGGDTTSPSPTAKWESRRCCPFPGTPCLPHTDFNPPPQVVRGLSAGSRVFEYMTLSPRIPLSGGHCIPREHLRGSITFHNVCFRSASVLGAGVFLCGLRAGEGACLGTCGSMSPSK